MEPLTSELEKSLLVGCPELGEITREAKRQTRHFPLSSTGAGTLEFVARLVKPSRVLDLGLGYGTSSLVLSRVVGEAGEVEAIDRDAKAIRRAERNLLRAGVQNVQIFQGEASNVLEDLAGLYDLIFLDLNPDHYCALWEKLAGLVRIGGVIVTENLWDSDTCREIMGGVGFRRVNEFSCALARDRRFFTAIVGESMAASIRLE